MNLIDNGTLVFTTDFRQVYATAIEDWLEVDSKKVLKEHLKDSLSLLDYLGFRIPRVERSPESNW